MALTGAEAVVRFGENEVRFDDFLNDSESYDTRLGVTVESVPHLMARLQEHYLNVVSRGEWATATAYVQNDLVTQGGVVYLCVTAHTSGTFATDLSSGDWVIYQETLLESELATSSGATMVGYVPGITGGEATTVDKRLDERISIKGFGAIGDGVADDSVAFLTAATWLNANGGGKLHLPKGTYRVGNLWAITTGNVTIEGDGIGATTIKVIATGVDGIRIANGYPATTSVISKVTIRDLSVNMNTGGYTHNSTDTNGNGINLNGVDKYLVERCEVYGCDQQGIVSTYWEAGSVAQTSGVIDSCIVHDVYASNIGIGIEGQSRGNRITNCDVYDMGTSSRGIYVGYAAGSGTTQTGHTVSHNRIVGPGTTGCEGIRVEDNVYSVNIENNQVKACDFGIRCSSNATSTFGFNIVGNTIIDYLNAGIITGPMYGSDTAKAVIANNRVVSSTAVAGSGGIYTSTACVISGNYVNNTGTYGSAVLCAGPAFVTGNWLTSPSYSVNAIGSGVVVGPNYCTSDINRQSDTLVFGTAGFATQRWTNMYFNTTKNETGTAAPTTGTWGQGDRVWNVLPAAGGYTGWICVSAGTPGTWKGFGVIAS